jgi:hypothetical protein
MAAPTAASGRGGTFARWFHWRWGCTTPIGRLSFIGFVTVLAMTALVAASWVVHDRLVTARVRRDDDIRAVAAALLRVSAAVRVEGDQALALCQAMWLRADANATALEAPPSALPGESDHYVSAATRTDDETQRATELLAKRSDLLAGILGDAALAPTRTERVTTSGVLSAHRRAHLSSRGTRNPGVTQDAARLEEFVASSFVIARHQRNLEGFDAWPSADSMRLTASQLGVYALRDLRVRVAPTLAAAAEEVVERYAAVELGVLRLAIRIGMRYGESRTSQAVRSAVAASTASAVADLLDAADAVVHGIETDSASVVSQALQFAALFDAVEYVLANIIPAMIHADDVDRLLIASDFLSDLTSLKGLRGKVELALGSERAMAAATLEAASLVDDLTGALEAAYDSTADSHTSDSELRYLPLTVTLLVVSAVLFTLSAAEQRHHAENVVRSRRDLAMEQTIQYVATVSHAVRHFDLNAAAAEVVAQSGDATTSPGLCIVHNRLQRMVAGLKQLAPSVSPLMFPERAAASAEYYSLVRRSGPAGSATVGAAQHGVQAGITTTTAPKAAEQRLLTRAAVDGEPLDESTEERVAPRTEPRFATFLAVDMAGLLEYHTSFDSMEVAKEYVPLLASLVEECIVLHGGVFHSLHSHALLGSWNASQDAPVPDACEAAARAAFVLVARLGMMRREHAALNNRFEVSIAITAGDITYCVFPQALVSSVAQFVGPPVARLPSVLRTNYHHQTAIAVDDVTAEKLAARNLPCKPIELLATAMINVVKGSEGTGNNQAGQSAKRSRGDSLADSTRAATTPETEGLAFELISLAKQRDPDLPAKLAEYKLSFAVYQRGYHAEALKGFRRYTKLYGYDGSVERIQSLIVS